MLKGYYQSEADLVARVRADLTGGGYAGKFKTVECQIMDIADDIAYSTYDIEDSFKGGFLRPIDLINPDPKVLQAAAESASDDLEKHITFKKAFECLLEVMREWLPPAGAAADEYLQDVYTESKLTAESGFHRSWFTSDLVSRFVRSVRLIPRKDLPVLSQVSIPEGERVIIEVLKKFVYHQLIASHRWKIVAERAKVILREIWQALASPGGHVLLPPDFARRFDEAPKGRSTLSEARARVLCDFIAGMTDRYAVEFYGRLTSESPATVFKGY